MKATTRALRTPHSELRTLRGLSIGVVGAGKMGQAMIGGLLARGVPRRAIRAAEASGRTRAEVSRRFRIRVTSDGAAVARGADVVILAVKPQQVVEALRQIGPALRSRQLVVSIAAGLTTRWLERRLPAVPVVRVMPNLPATVSCGFSAIAPGRRATARHRAIAHALFSAVGEAVELPERAFDAVTAVSGSGPAYVFLLVQMWEEAARSLGLPAAVAGRAIRATLAGSTRLLRASGEPADVLVQQVASKGGTTEAALKVLAKRRVSAAFAEALRAAARRSKQLAKT